MQIVTYEDSSIDGKYEIMQKVAQRTMPYFGHYDVDIRIILGLKCSNSVDIWSVDVKKQGQPLELVFTDRINKLSNKAFEGLAYASMCNVFLDEMFRHNLQFESDDECDECCECEEYEEVNIQVKRIDAAMLDAFVTSIFDLESLVQYRIEASNLAYKEGRLDVAEFREYIHQLDELCPAAAEPIMRGLVFKKLLKT